MKAISNLTGFSPTLLRAWERRYDFLKPRRLPSGHRIYTENDLVVLKRVKELLEAGHSVGEVSLMGRQGLLTGFSSRDRRQVSEEAKQIAPRGLPLKAKIRYCGEDLGVSLSDLTPQDSRFVVELYEVLKSTYELWLYMDEEARNEELVWKRLERLVDKRFCAELEKAGRKAHYPNLTRAAVQDATCGALNPLLSHLRGGSFCQVGVRTCVLLARDQAKMMRNAFPDLDPVLRDADESEKAHHIRGMAEKVTSIQGNIEAILDWEGSVSSRCLETSTVDRILYDFLRRLEQTGSPSLLLWVGPVNKDFTRWAFKFEEGRFAVPDVCELATIAVAGAAGVTPATALSEGYIGAAKSWAWFHWPIFRPDLGAPVCQCEI